MTAQQQTEPRPIVTWASMSDVQLTRTLAAMSMLGGGFVQAMAIAMYRADPGNLRRLQDAFPELAGQYGPGSLPYLRREGDGE